MDPTAALNILQNHARQKQAELAQEAEKDKLELTAVRHLGAFCPDTDAATAHLERRPQYVSY